ncbi:DNA mismatch repair protein MLH3-like [Solanum dulcamara]|uniref:DNA mismatch repair protein MLH3-like n=1 Tax=Solanum dulcamara TaxID=45834 RepID=UPI00248642F0|nr:DNA mismatch repair protein MLH3-like [Solanum dulcamara]
MTSVCTLELMTVEKMLVQQDLVSHKMDCAGKKICAIKIHAFPASFGFKGEALSSIFDISLLEIVTKTHRRPSGYCKVFKDGKWLYLGIDDCRQNVGITVIVRYVFYNEPVQRKQIHSQILLVYSKLKQINNFDLHTSLAVLCPD